MQAQRQQSQDEIIEALQRQVDELTKANFLLEDQLARKEQFIAMVAHELRGPLTPHYQLCADGGATGTTTGDNSAWQQGYRRSGPAFDTPCQ